MGPYTIVNVGLHGATKTDAIGISEGIRIPVGVDQSIISRALDIDEHG